MANTLVPGKLPCNHSGLRRVRLEELSELAPARTRGRDPSTPQADSLRKTLAWTIDSVFQQSVFQQLPCNHQALNLAGAFSNGAEFHVAIELFGGIVFDVAVAAVDLHAFIGTPYRNFAGVELGHGG